MIENLTPNLINQQVYIKFKRGNNDLNTDKAAINKEGMAQFNEKIEMKTTIVDGQDKMSVLTANLANGQVIGKCDFNLADYRQPKKYQKQLPLSDVTVGSSSFITVEVITSDASKPAKSSNR